MLIMLFLLSAALTLTVCLKAEAIGRALGIMDVPDPEGRKRHRQATPLVGGLAVILPVIATALYNSGATGIPIFHAYALVLGGGLILGLLDDRNHLPPSFRLGAAAIVAMVGIWMFPAFEIQFLRFTFLDVPIFTDGWGLPFTVLCLVGLQNAVNMADGKNGLVIGLSFIWGVILCFYAPVHLYPLLATLLAGLAITLAFNLQSKLFLGDAGAYALSLAVGLLALYIYNVSFVSVPADMVALWFLIPVVDCVRLMARRMMQKRSPFSPDREHLHHILLRFMGWDKALIAYLSIVFIPCLLAMWLPQLTLLWAGLVMTVYVMVLGAARILQVEEGQPHSSR